MGSGDADQCQGHSWSRLAVFVVAAAAAAAVAAVASLMDACLDLIADSADNQYC